jgi:hypothetical protein
MGLHEKMYQIMCESESLKKDMQVGETGKSYSYKAISEATVLNLIKPLFKTHKLIIFPVGVDINELDTRKMTQLKTKWKLVDIESGEFELLEAPGNGADSQDKGSGKAWTYAYKAVLQKTFMLFSGEDTDNTHSDEIGKSEEEPKKITTQMLLDIAKTKNIFEGGLIARYKKDTGKTISEVKFIPQDYKTKYYNAIKELDLDHKE